MKHTGRKSHKPKKKASPPRIFNPITEFQQAVDFVNKLQKEKGEVIGYTEAEIEAIREESKNKNYC